MRGPHILAHVLSENKVAAGTPGSSWPGSSDPNAGKSSAVKMIAAQVLPHIHDHVLARIVAGTRTADSLCPLNGPSKCLGCTIFQPAHGTRPRKSFISNPPKTTQRQSIRKSFSSSPPPFIALTPPAPDSSTAGGQCTTPDAEVIIPIDGSKSRSPRVPGPPQGPSTARCAQAANPSESRPPPSR